MAEYNPDRLEVRNANAHVLHSVEVLPLVALQWTANSKNLVAVESIAHGSDAVIIHYTGAGWKSFTAIPPGRNFDDYAVIALEHKDSSINLVYKATDSHGMYRISFAIDPASGAPSNVREQKITFEQWSALKPLANRSR